MHKQSASINEQPSHQTLSQNKKASSSSTKHSIQLAGPQQYNMAQCNSSTNSGNLRAGRGNAASASVFANQRGHQPRASLGHVPSQPMSTNKSAQSKKLTQQGKNQGGPSQLLAQKSEAEKKGERGNSRLVDYTAKTKNFHSRASAGSSGAAGAASQLMTPVGLMINTYDHQQKSFEQNCHSQLGGDKQGVMAPQILTSSHGASQQMAGGMFMVQKNLGKENFEMRSNSNDITGNSLDSQTFMIGQKMQKSMVAHAAMQKNHQSSGNLNASRASYCQGLNQQQNQPRQMLEGNSQQRAAPSSKQSAALSKTTFLSGACAGLNSNQNSSYPMHQQYASSQLSQQKQMENMRVHGADASRKNTLSQSDFHQEISNNGQPIVNIVGQRHMSKNGSSACSTSLDKYQQQHGIKSAEQSTNALTKMTNTNPTNSSRIPQESIISSATGNMNQMQHRPQFVFNQSPRLNQPFNLVSAGNSIPSGYGKEAAVNSSRLAAGFSSQPSGEKDGNQQSSSALQSQLLVKVSGRKSDAFLLQPSMQKAGGISTPNTTTQSTGKRGKVAGINPVLSQVGNKSSKMTINDVVNQGATGRMVQEPMIINRQNGMSNPGRRSLGQSKTGAHQGHSSSSRQNLQQRSRDSNHSKNTINLSLSKPQDDVALRAAQQACHSTTSATGKFKQVDPRFGDQNVSAIGVCEQPGTSILNASVIQASGHLKRMRSGGNPNTMNAMMLNKSSGNANIAQQQQNASSATRQHRYPQNSQRVMAGGTAGTRVRIDARLGINETVRVDGGQQPSQAMPSNNSFIGVDKYHERHVHDRRNRDSGIIKKFTENKSGQNLNNNFALSNGMLAKQGTHAAPRTSRVNQSINQSFQNNKTKTSVVCAGMNYNGMNTGTASAMSAKHQGSLNKGGSMQFGKQTATMSTQLSSQQQDKENKHKLANKGSSAMSSAQQKALGQPKGSTQGFNIVSAAESYEQVQQLKRVRTSETGSRQSISNPVAQPHQKQSHLNVPQRAMSNTQGQTGKTTCSGNKIMKSTSSKGKRSSKHCSADKFAVDAPNLGSRDVSDQNRPMTTSGRGTIGKLSSSRQKKQLQQNSSQQKIEEVKQSESSASHAQAAAKSAQFYRLEQQIVQTSMPDQLLQKPSSAQQSTEQFGLHRSLHTLQAEPNADAQVLSNRAPRQLMSEANELDAEELLERRGDSEASTKWQISQQEGQLQPQGEVHIIRAHQEEQNRQIASSRPEYVDDVQTQEVRMEPVGQQVSGQLVLPEENKEDAEIEMVGPDEEEEEVQIIDVASEMAERRRVWLQAYKTTLDLNDVLEIRNPQSVIEFVPEIIVNMQQEELGHMYPADFLHASKQHEISERYRQYLVDWLAELHYKFKMVPETLFVTVGIIDKTLQRWKNFRKTDLQCLGVTALHIAGKYEEIYPPDLRTILDVIDNAVTHSQVCNLEKEILETLDFDMVWPSVLRFMQRYACVSNFSQEQHMIAQMFCDFTLYNVNLLKQRASLLGALAIYATNKISNRSRPWNQSLVKATLGVREDQLKPLVNELFFSVKKLEVDTMRTMFRKYELQRYFGVIVVLQKIQLPQHLLQRLTRSNNNGQRTGQTSSAAIEQQPQQNASQQQMDTNNNPQINSGSQQQADRS